MEQAGYDREISRADEAWALQDAYGDDGEVAGEDADASDGDAAGAAAEDADEVTGASPGTAQACSEFGLNSLESNLARFGIKPPGVA